MSVDPNEAAAAAICSENPVCIPHRQDAKRAVDAFLRAEAENRGTIWLCWIIEDLSGKARWTHFGYEGEGGHDQADVTRTYATEQRPHHNERCGFVVPIPAPKG